MCCNHPLVEEEDECYDEDEFVMHQYKCPHCGLIEQAVLVEVQEQENYPAYSGGEDPCGDVSHGYPGLCPECGHHIIWGADFMRSEVWGDVPMTKENQKKYDELCKKIEEAETKLRADLDKDWRETLNSDLERMKRERIDLEYEGIDDEEDSLAPSVTCPYCGAAIQLVYPMTSERKKYEFYKDEQ